MSYLIKDLPSNEKPRERLMMYGVAALSNEELLSILLRCGTKNKSVKELSFDILKKYSLNGVIHCFNGSIEVANLYIKLGYCLGIGGVITFKNSKLFTVVENIPLENIVLETDSPYLAPEPYRGSTNSPKYIPIIVDKISSIKKVSTKEVEKITTNNVFRIFDLK